MPLPIALAALALGSAAFGTKKGYDAITDNQEAKKKKEKAKQVYKSAQGHLKKSRERATQALTSLGTLKIEMWSDDLGRFTDLFGRLKNVEVKGGVGLGELSDFVATQELGDMRNTSLKAQELVKGGVASLGSGALAGVAAYGGAMTFASASTGTAIASLSGAAATNATLAWFGGGSLAAGGAGMAGGMVILGGLVAGPVLAVGGLVWSASAKKNLAEARQHLAKARAASSEMNTAAQMVDGIRKVVLDVEVVLRKLRVRFGARLDAFEELQADVGVDWNKFSQKQKKDVQEHVHWAQIVKGLLEAPLLTDDGAMNQKHVQPLRTARRAMGD